MNKYKITTEQEDQPDCPVGSRDLGLNVVLNYSNANQAYKQETHNGRKYKCVQDVIKHICGYYDHEPEVYNEETEERESNPEPRQPANLVCLFLGSRNDYGGYSWSKEDPANMDDDDRREAIIWITPADMEREGWEDAESAEKYARAMCKTLTQWGEGDIYSFTIKDAETGEILDNCGGFYGEEDAQAEADSMVKYYKYRDQEAINFVNQFFHT